MLRIRLALSLLCLTLPLSSLRAQTLSSRAAPSWMETLARPAGMIFSGTVIRVRRDASRTNYGTVHIAFRVDDAVRGCVPGETVEISEWAGSWRRANRYRRGERLLLFLYARNGKGLTSPVAGALGAIKLDEHGALQLTAAQAAVFNATRPTIIAPVWPARPSVSLSPPLSHLSKDDAIARIREAK